MNKKMMSGIIEGRKRIGYIDYKLFIVVDGSRSYQQVPLNQVKNLKEVEK